MLGVSWGVPAQTQPLPGVREGLLGKTLKLSFRDEWGEQTARGECSWQRKQFSTGPEEGTEHIGPGEAPVPGAQRVSRRSPRLNGGGLVDGHAKASALHP